jgi:hypothetical protein
MLVLKTVGGGMVVVSRSDGSVLGGTAGKNVIELISKPVIG